MRQKRLVNNKSPLPRTRAAMVTMPHSETVGMLVVNSTVNRGLFAGVAFSLVSKRLVVGAKLDSLVKTPC